MPALFVTSLPLRTPSTLHRSTTSPLPKHHHRSTSTSTSPRRRARLTMAETPPKVLVPIGNGSEEIETSSIVDTLRRVGAQVTLASVEPTTSVNMSRGMVFQADTLISSCSPPYDAIALPGGMPGAERLADSAHLVELMQSTREAGKLVAAICASPAVVLARHGFLDGKKATCYPAPGFVQQIVKKEGEDVVVDGQLVTGTGPGTALKFSLMLVEKLYSKNVADKLAEEMLVVR